MWNFGDGSFSSLTNPSHKYLDTGFFNVKLTVWNNGCVDSLKVDSFVHINPPIAKFNVAFNCNEPYKRVFTDQSIGADQWFWDFGDGTTSNLKNPIHSYIRQGIFNVSLRVVNNLYGCEFSIVKQVQIVDVQTKFTASDTVPCKGRQITFTTGLVTANVASFNWFTGDNPNPVVVSGVSSLNYTYRSSGYYTVKLITRDILGCIDTVVKNSYIRVDGPTAKFSVVQPGVCLNSTVSFVDSSFSDGINSIQSWMYNYGDGSTQTLSSGAAQHAYANPGSYTVSLRLTDTKGCTDQVNLPAPFIVSKPIAKFITNDTINCPGHTITFTNQSTGPNLSYQWNFGDGGIASIVNPVHPYATAGRYDVKLVIVDRYGCTDSITKYGVVNIVLPAAGFSMSDSLGFCPPMLVQFTNQSQYMVSKVWDFGDSTFSTMNDPSHFYTKAGVYNVKLNIVGIGGCTSVLTKQIVLRGPRGSFSYNARTGCNPLSITFIGHTEEAAKFIWDFNDGNIQETVDSNVVHVFTDPGSFLPKMILEDSTGCRVPIPGIDTILVKGVVAKFKFNDIALCDSGRVVFTDSSISNDVIRGYKWIFGDGYFDSIKNASHTYHTSGLYYPTLVVNTAAGCTDTIASSVPVRIVKSPNISIVASANGCVPLQVQLSARLNVADTSLIQWGWRFADGSASSLVQPQLQQYPNAGNFPVSLKATNSSGCATIVNHNIEAYPIPIVSVGNDQLLCKGSTMRLTASGADSYSWSPAIDLSCVNCSTTVTSTLLDMQYVVAGTTIHGCSAKDTIKINVKEKFIMKHSQGKSLCKGESHEVRASGADSYVWFPVNGLKNATDSIQDAHPGVTTTYRVIGSDNVGCFKDTGFITIVVYPIPTVEAGMNRTINVGQSIDLIPAISSDVTEVQWFPNDGLTRNMFPGITVRPNANIDYTVEVKNIGGCTARDKISVFVLCNGGNVFIPNTFSPDGNGVNDVFYPRGTGLYRIKNMKIYNRWGEVMYERSSFLANDATASWDGTFKGKKLSPDVFVYTIDIICDNNAVLKYQGNVALVR